jgi:hypothetical protein
MPTNFFFDEYNDANQQSLVDDLSVEMIEIYGVELMYVPRTHVNIDRTFMEDPLSRFDKYFEIEGYIKNFEGWQGEGDLMSKFGFSMADQITFAVSRTRFSEEVSSILGTQRPMEGDLIYMPMTKTIFEVKFVEHESLFYTQGNLYSYEIHCERFNYSDEIIDTGAPDVDQVETDYSDAVNDRMLVDNQNRLVLTDKGLAIILPPFAINRIDPAFQNEDFASSDEVSFDPASPFGGS